MKRLAPCLCVTIAALSLGACVSACGSDDSTAKELAHEREIDQAKADAKRDEQLKQLQKKQKEEENKQKQSPSGSGGDGSGGGGGSSGGGAAVSGSPCSTGLSVGPGTTCAYAENVRTEYNRAGRGNVTVGVYSPVTQQTYEVTCNEGVTTVCISNTGAKVYIQ